MVTHFELLGTVLDNFIKCVDENEGIKQINVLPDWIDLKEEIKVEESQKEDNEKKKKKRNKTSQINCHSFQTKLLSL